MARARRRWIREQGLLDSTHLVFIDETSVNTNMTRAYGRGLEGERVIGRVLRSLEDTDVRRGIAMRGHDRANVDQGGDERRSLSHLCRTVSGPHDEIVVWTMSGTQGRGRTTSIEAAGASLRYLPPYSPDLNPIEAAYSACKAFLRKCAERTELALSRRIGQFVRRLQPEVCANFFAHAGYAT